MVRCPTDREHGQWRLALDTQTADNTKARYIHPVLKSPPHPQKVHFYILNIDEIEVLFKLVCRFVTWNSRCIEFIN